MAPSAIDIDTINIIHPGTTNDEGVIEVDITGGTSPYTILWSNGEVSEDLSGLSAGSYILSVEDANGCQATASFDLTVEPLSYESTVVQNDCADDCIGSIIVTVSGGVMPYTYAWSDGSMDPSITNLCDGQYLVTITDQLGTELISSPIMLSSPPAIELMETISPISCIDMEDGSILLHVSGGTAPYNYSWNNGVESMITSNLGAASYTVTVTDDLGCTSMGEYVIAAIETIDLEVDAIAPDCESPLGAIVISGDNPYNYDIFINDQIAEIDNGIISSPAGSYAISYLVNEACIIPVDQVVIPAVGVLDIALTETYFKVDIDESVPLSLLISTSYDIDELEILWNADNAFECNDDFCQDITIYPTEDEIASVIVTDPDGCTASLVYEIVVNKPIPEIHLPNAISPNGDGVNEYFSYSSSVSDVIIEQVYIYDRWGNLMHHLDGNYAPGDILWDGTYHGTSLNPGVYIYTLDATVAGKKEIIYGDLTLLK